MYQAPMVIVNIANTPNTTISFSKIVSRRLSIVSPAPSHMRTPLPGVISDTLIVKSASAILLADPYTVERDQISNDIRIRRVRNIFFIA
jgi:hypothetical protein